MDFNGKREYVGNMDQLFMLRECTLLGGRQQGVRAVELFNGANLDMTVLPDRCMDFYQIRYKGKSMNYISPSGIVSPEYFFHDGDGFIDSFYCGFLTTCGFSNIGSPCEDDGKRLGLHGKLPGTPASNVSARVEIIDGAPAAVIQGTMHESAIFGLNLSLKRTITVKYGEDSFSFVDEVTNESYSTLPFMLLYHFNTGYPLLSEHAKLNIPSKGVRPRTAYAADYIGQWREITPPASPYSEMCYYHDMEKDSDGKVSAGISNPNENTELNIIYDGNVLDNFVQWKMLGKGEYVMGLEPCNATIGGRPAAKDDGSLKYIEPGQRIKYPFTIKFSDCK